MGNTNGQENQLYKLNSMNILKLCVVSCIWTGNINETTTKNGTNNNITSASTIFHDTIERSYPDYPVISDIQLSHHELVRSVYCLLSYVLY